MPFANVLLASVLFGSYVLLWSAMAVSPIDWHSWVLASVIPTVVVGGLVVIRRALPLSRATTRTPEFPFGDALSPLLGSGRNDDDRMVHFAFGLLLAYPVQEVLARVTNARGFLLYYVPGMTLVGLSGLWEVLKSWVARIASPDLGAAYLGSQGDV